jgi:uncharacterized OB-fold protein
MSTPTRVPAIEGWFTMDAHRPALVGQRCRACGTYSFPPTVFTCPNPGCDGSELDSVELSRTGTVWSYTDARYQPPPPYVVPGDKHKPFAIAAVELASEGLVVMGQVAPGVSVDDLAVGDSVELVLDTLFTEGDTEHVVWKWRPIEASR